MAYLAVTIIKYHGYRSPEVTVQYLQAPTLAEARKIAVKQLHDSEAVGTLEDWFYLMQQTDELNDLLGVDFDFDQYTPQTLLDTLSDKDTFERVRWGGDCDCEWCYTTIHVLQLPLTDLGHRKNDPLKPIDDGRHPYS